MCGTDCDSHRHPAACIRSCTSSFMKPTESNVIRHDRPSVLLPLLVMLCYQLHFYITPVSIGCAFEMLFFLSAKRCKQGYICVPVVFNAFCWSSLLSLLIIYISLSIMFQPSAYLFCSNLWKTTKTISRGFEKVRRVLGVQ